MWILPSFFILAMIEEESDEEEFNYEEEFEDEEEGQ